MLILVLILLNCFDTSQTQEASQFISVDPDTQMLVDESGREVFFHGVNVVSKQPPYHPSITGFGPHTFSETDMNILQELGLNTIRLGMMMPGYVPKRGVYNETYLAVIEHIVSTAAKYGIYTLLDMHQDVLSRKLCGEGLPDWIIDTKGARPFPYPLTDVKDAFKINPKTGYPYTKDCGRFEWGDYYFTDATAKAFQNLYDNVGGLRDAWGEFWKKTAKTFRKYPSIIGYELMNEPFAGDIYTNPLLLLLPGHADKLNLQPTYDALQQYIRQVDQRHIIFFEGLTWDFLFVGFDNVPGGENYRNRSVLSYHYYEPPDFSKRLNFDARKRDLEYLKCGGFLTEMYTEGSRFDSMYEMFDLADEYKQSWQGWGYKGWTSRPGQPQITVQNLTRTYPQAVAGKTNSYSFDRESHRFSLTYEVSGKCRSLRTEVYFNKKMHYTNGYKYEVGPLGHVRVQESGDGLKLYLDHSKNLMPGTIITFNLEPK